MKKKILIILTLVIVLTLCLCACNNDSSSSTVVTNGSFEALSSNSTNVATWTKSSGSNFEFLSNKNDGSNEYQSSLGSRYAKVVASNSFDYIYQTVSLKKNTNYKISAYVNVASITPTSNIGFRIGFLEDSDFVGLNVVESTDGWESIEYYFTSSTSSDMTLTVGIGSSVVNATGTASVDNIKIEEVSTIPSSFVESVDSVELLKKGSSFTLSDGGSITFVVLLSLFSVLAVLCLVFALKFAMKEPKMLDDSVVLTKGQQVLKTATSNFALFLYVLCGAFLIRFLFIALTYGMNSSIEALVTISTNVTTSGLASFYPTVTTSTDSIGMVYLYGILGYFAKAMNIESTSLGMAILMRLPQMLAELYVVYAIYTFAANQQNERMAAVYSALFAFLPIFFIFGCFYASEISIVMALLVGMFICLLSKKHVATGVLYTLSVLISYYSLIILPLIMFYQIYTAIKDKDSRIKIIIEMCVSLVVVLALGVVLTWSEFKTGKVFSMFTKMYEFFTAQKYLSADAFNVYSIFGLANKSGRSRLLEVCNWLFVIGMNSWAIFLYIKDKNKLDIMLNSSVMFGAYAVLGAQGTMNLLPLSLVLLLMYLVIVLDKRLFMVYGALSTLSFLNIAQIASVSGFISQNSKASYLAFASNSAFLIVFSIITVLAMVYYIYVSIDVSYYNQSSEIVEAEGNISSEIKGVFSFNTKKRS